jgi:uncharacterized protein YcbX
VTSTGAITVTGLHTYPVKSCAGVSLAEAPITPRGLQHDRDFMIVLDDGTFVSQRQVPELALIVPTITETSMTLSAPGMDPIKLAPEGPNDSDGLVEATVHGNPVVGQHITDELDEWFTTFLPVYRQNRRYRLLRVRADMPRPIKERYRLPGASNQIGFADGQPILLATEPSLARLNTEMSEPVPMNRFRPNIVVDSDELAAYEEDHWIELRIGAMTAFVVKACDRCAIPDVDQSTASTGKAVRRALTTRRGVNAHDETNAGVFFAQNLNHIPTSGLAISVGDPVHVISRASEPNVVLRRAARPVATWS